MNIAKDTTVTKELIKSEYSKLKEHLGRQPSSKDFYKQTNIKEHHVITHFLFYSNLVEEMGDIRKSFGQEDYGDEEYWENYGNLIRKIRKTPTAAEWRFYKCKPLISSYIKRFDKKWSEIPSLFLNYAKDKPEWLDIIPLIPSALKENVQVPIINNSLEFKYSQFIPPILSDFLTLSTSEEKSTEFERKVNLIFQMLGFEVHNYGQGTGRNPDGIAKATQFGYAILIDAKARKETYQIGTEDRKFIEYIKTHINTLNRAGHSIVYFLIVSSNFKSASDISLKNILRETGINTTLITAVSLLKILARKIEQPNNLPLDRIKDIFITQGMITDKQIEKFLLAK